VIGPNSNSSANPVTPSQRLKAAADALGHGNIANMLCVNPKTLWRWINGRSQMTADAVVWLEEHGF
jgi:plasmid maintenance system antidote protein VapI